MRRSIMMNQARLTLWKDLICDLIVNYVTVFVPFSNFVLFSVLLNSNCCQIGLV